MKTVWTAAAGNPYLSKEEVEQRSWSDTLNDNAVSHVRDADYSAESMQAGVEGARQAWAQAKEDVATSTVTPDAPFDPKTQVQWDGPEQASFARRVEP